MADFRATICDTLAVRAAAVAPHEAVRLVELEALLDGKLDSDYVSPNDHSPVTVSSSQSISLSLDDQDVSASLRLDANPGLVVGSGGVKVKFGTGAFDVPAGNHVHANDHVAATADATQTDSITVTLTAQAIKAAIKLATGGALKVVAGQGVAADVGTGSTQVAAGNHTHSGATTSVAGFMSAADKLKLDGLSGSGTNFIDAVEDTQTISLSVDSGTLNASVIYGSGLTIFGGALAVDFSAVAAFSHSHAVATSLASGFMSAADKTRLDGLTTGSAITVTDTASIGLTLDTDELSADIVLASNSGLEVVGGLRCKFGTGQYDVAAGNHTHANDHVAATADATQTDSITVTLTAQAIKAAIKLQTSGGLKVVAGQGVAADVGTGATQVSAGNHTHAGATTSVAGFMSAADKLKLDGMSGSGLISEVDDTQTVSLSVDSGTLSASVIYGSGLTITGGALAVDFATVSAVGHSHADATSATAGFMSAADKLRLDLMRTLAQQDARNVIKVGNSTSTQIVTTALELQGGAGAAAGLIVTNDVWAQTKVYIGETQDAFLYREGAGEIKTDTDFTVGGVLSSPTSPTSGSGSPEGAVTGSPGKPYADISVDPPILWVKYTGSGNTGWRQFSEQNTNYVLNETTLAWHKIRALTNGDGVLEEYLDPTAVATALIPALNRIGYVLNETSGLYHRIRAKTNDDGFLEKFLDPTGVA